ncbi:MAG: hypothetical protein JST11_13815 [Acidobacteria bacterium]|nr:hypothetical protein [Acidobacteriota bacterium]
MTFINTEDSGNNQTVPPLSMFRTQQHFNIPDMSDCGEYFQAHHMEVQSVDGTPIFSFWDNDDANYALCCCSGRNCTSGTNMPGYFDGGNNATVGIMISQPTGAYAIQAYKVMNDV